MRWQPGCWQTRRVADAGGARMIRDRLAAPFRAFWRWQSEIPDQGRIVVVGLLLIALGLLPAWPPQPAAILPGIVLVAAGLGFTLAHPVVAAVAVGGTALVAFALVWSH